MSNTIVQVVFSLFLINNQLLEASRVQIPHIGGDCYYHVVLGRLYTLIHLGTFRWGY